MLIFFFQAEDGIRDSPVTGVQTCALPIYSTYTDTINSASEIKARGAKIIGISDKNSDIYDYWIEVPKTEEAFYPLIEIIPIQLLAYYAALEKNTDPDYPRNLAKSVTVK